MKTTLGIIFFPLFLLSHFSCDSVEPDDNGNGIDTTSHNFTFQTWTFGEHSGSTLYDATVLNDTLIWAVGEIYLNDSLGQPDPKRYNAVIWNRNNWNIIRIPYDYQGTDFYHPIQSAFAFGSNDIWFCGNGIIHWDGNNFIPIPIPTNVWGPYQMNKIWGSSGSDLYVVGNNGNIAHYNGSQWSSIGSGTSLNINDIWGIKDQNGIRFILCPAYDFGSGGEKKLISISNNTVGEIPWVENRELYTVWFNSRDKIYAGGEGLFYRTNNEWKEETLPALFKFRVRGNGLNDIWTVGGYGFATHYNGKNWKTFEEVSLASGNYVGLAVKGNIVVITGNEGNKAVITIGKRN